MKYHVSLIDSDIYKFTMQMAICQLYPRVLNHYRFVNRDNREFPDGFDKCLIEIVDSFRGIALKKDEKDFMLEKCYYLNPVYLDFLSGYRYDPKEVIIKQEGPKLSLDIIGPAYHTVLWEVPLMATISELYFEMTGQRGYDLEKLTEINKQKAQDLAYIDVYYSEFGTRRRKSFENQNKVVEDLKKYGKGHLLGTSNVYLAMIHDLMPAGTVAHEWYSLHAALYGFIMANEKANDAWISVFHGDLGTGLPDTFTTDVFLQSFNTKYAKLYDGLRQDSGEPLAFLEKVLAHYNKLRVNPLYKMLLFSDNLKSIEQIKTIHEACKGRTNDRYGIGTWLSNHVGVKPLNMVIKLIGCLFDETYGWVNTIKLSDDINKNTGDLETIELCKKTLIK
jgi:nicotinate phosphoribosyltransferase